MCAAYQLNVFQKLAMLVSAGMTMGNTFPEGIRQAPLVGNNHPGFGKQWFVFGGGIGVGGGDASEESSRTESRTLFR